MSAICAPTHRPNPTTIRSPSPPDERTPCSTSRESELEREGRESERAEREKGGKEREGEQEGERERESERGEREGRERGGREIKRGKEREREGEKLSLIHI